MTYQWYKVVAFGDLYWGPRGPWKSVAEAEAEIQKWCDTYPASNLWKPNRVMASSGARIVGPFSSSRQARDAEATDDLPTVKWLGTRHGERRKKETA